MTRVEYRSLVHGHWSFDFHYGPFPITCTTCKSRLKVPRSGGRRPDSGLPEVRRDGDDQAAAELERVQRAEGGSAHGDGVVGAVGCD